MVGWLLDIHPGSQNRSFIGLTSWPKGWWWWW